MTPLHDEEPGGGLPFSTLMFVASAAVAAAAIRFAWHQPLVAGVLLAAALVLAASRFVSRLRLRRLLQSGDVESVLRRWSGSLDRVPHRATMGPLMTATAFAAYGWIDRARSALASAERGPAWEAAIEHRLFLDALLLAFEGDREQALARATRLARLPLPLNGSAVRGRVSMLRQAALALARAFAHQSEPGDRDLLERAGNASPLVFWAMRYAAAVVAIDQGDGDKARQLLDNAPRWPTESAFRAFHDEITARTASSEPRTEPTGA